MIITLRTIPVPDPPNSSPTSTRRQSQPSMTVASLSAISGPKFVMYASKSARTSPFMAKKSRASPPNSNLSTPEGLSGRGQRKLSASRFMESVLSGLGLGATKHEQFLTVPGEQQHQQCGTVEGSVEGEGKPRQKSKSLAMIFPRNASDDDVSSKVAMADDKIGLSKMGGEPVEVFIVDERVVLPRVEITDTDAADGNGESVHDSGKLETRSQSSPNNSGRSRKSGVNSGSPQQSIVLEELRQIKKLRQIIDTPSD